jgi:hypothetical protein
MDLYSRLAKPFSQPTDLGGSATAEDVGTPPPNPPPRPPRTTLTATVETTDEERSGALLGSVTF